jgi:hypothetical protein
MNLAGRMCEEGCASVGCKRLCVAMQRIGVYAYTSVAVAQTCWPQTHVALLSGLEVILCNTAQSGS